MSLDYLLVSASYTDDEVKDIFEKHDVKVTIFDHFEKVAKALRDEIEVVYLDRCAESTLNDCGKTNYNERSSKFPNPTCFNINSTSECGCGECV